MSYPLPTSVCDTGEEEQPKEKGSQWRKTSHSLPKPDTEAPKDELVETEEDCERRAVASHALKWVSKLSTHLCL
jgi:hypothetical protein